MIYNVPIFRCQKKRLVNGPFTSWLTQFSPVICSCLLAIDAYRCNIFWANLPWPRAHPRSTLASKVLSGDPLPFSLGTPWSSPTSGTRWHPLRTSMCPRTGPLSPVPNSAIGPSPLNRGNLERFGRELSREVKLPKFGRYCHILPRFRIEHRKGYFDSLSITIGQITDSVAAFFLHWADLRDWNG